MTGPRQIVVDARGGGSGRCHGRAWNQPAGPDVTDGTIRRLRALGSRDVVLTGHHSTVRVWNPFTGRKLTQLAVGTPIDSVDVQSTEDGRLFVAVGGPRLLLTELRA